MIRNNWKKHGLGVLFGALFFVICFSLLSTAPVSAASCGEGQVETSFFGCVIDDGTGCGVWLVINVIIDVMTYGIGIAAAIGLVISGIMYLTAHGSVPKADKAKKRIFEIIIGLVIYAVLWSIASLLLPGGTLNPSDTCKSVASNASSGGASFMSTENGGSSDDSTNNGELRGKTLYKKKINSKPFKLNVKSASKITYKSKSSRIAYVTKKGTVYPNDVGSTTIVARSGSKKLNIKIKISRRTSKPSIGEAAYGNNGYGDQSGKEVKTGKWYKNGSFADWGHVFRFKDPRKAEKAADAMIDTCHNNKIGYENGSKQRSMSFTYALRKVKWKPSKVKKKVGTACSQAVLTMVQVAGYHRGSRDYPYKDAVGTANKLSGDSHFYHFKDSKYTKGWKRLRRGDILVDSVGGTGNRHVVMVVR